MALWQLEEKAELNTDVRVLPFQREDRDVAADTVCEVAGWGTIDHSGRRPDKLQQVQRPVISRDVCNHRTRHDGTITHNMMCTDSRRKDTCKVPHTHHGSTEGWEGARGHNAQSLGEARGCGAGGDNTPGVSPPVLAAAEQLTGAWR